MNTQPMQYVAEGVVEEGQLIDVVAHLASGKSWRMWGREGVVRELALAESVPAGTLPVLLGAGLGVCLEALLEQGPVAVVDRETHLLDLTDIRKRFGKHPNLLLLSGEADAVMGALDDARKQLGATQLCAVRNPLYLRLVPGYYREIDERIEAMNEFHAAMRYPKFERQHPRILILEQPYFLYREIKTALTLLGSKVDRLALPETGTLDPAFITQLLTAIRDQRPDFVLTVNHFGLDQQGRLAGLLEELGIPLASWFVDSPQLIMNDFPRQSTPLTCVFSYDEASLPWLREAGFEQVHYLPLATDPERFAPGQAAPAAWRARVCFVGDSMTSQVEEMALAAKVAPMFQASLPELAYAFAESQLVLPLEFLRLCHPDMYDEVSALGRVEDRLACEKALTFTAARQYRLRCVAGIMPYEPIIAGDDGWADALGPAGWTRAGRLDYYRDVPKFYAASEVSFNCTSVQMKGAVNQRVFDVPACGGFVVTDWREQMEHLFDPDTEMACYQDPLEVPDVVASWLADPAGREKMTGLARRRILAEHTYQHRLETLLTVMRKTYE